MPRKRSVPTARGYQILKFIQDYRQVHGYSPTAREIAAWYQLSVSTVWSAIRTLARAGLLEHRARSPRTFVLSERGLKLLGGPPS